MPHDIALEQNELGSHRPYAAMAIIGCASLFACSFPSLSKRIRYLRIPPIIFFIGKHFGTGVILSTAFVHLLQDAFEALLDPAVKEANALSDWVGLIVLASLLAIFLVEYTSTAFVDHLHSHQNHDCPSDSTPKPDDERTPLLRPSSRTAPQTAPVMEQHGGGESYFSGHHHRHESPHKHEHHRAPNPRKSSSIIYGPEEFGQGRVAGVGHVHRHGEHMPGGHSHSHGMMDEHSAERTVDEESATAVDGEAEEEGNEDVGKRRQVVSILVLQMGIMIHSLVIGLTLSITSGPEFASLLVAVAFHQLFEGLSLGIRIASLPSPPRNGVSLLKVVLVMLFAITVPVGISVGLLALRQPSAGGPQDPHLQFVQGIMSAISAGMLVYAACVEMLAGDFVMDPLLWRSGFRRQALAIVSLLAGVAGMSIIGIWD